MVRHGPGTTSVDVQTRRTNKPSTKVYTQEARPTGGGAGRMRGLAVSLWACVGAWLRNALPSLLSTISICVRLCNGQLE